jgi:SAM-dependent methyltransferase
VGYFDGVRPTQRDQYFLGYSLAEQERLQRQAQELAPDTNQLFDIIGVMDGSRAIEVGCGPLGCLEVLSQRVGPKGSVVGLEISADAVALARRYLADQKIGNVEVRRRDGKATDLPRESFDLATARLVLVNIPEPERIVREMVALVKPGGVVALHEADWGLAFGSHAALDRLLGLLVDYSKANGIDPFVGRRLPQMLQATGLVDVQVNPILHVHPLGHPRRMILLQFAENLRDRILAQGLISAAEFDESLAAAKLHLEDPATLVLSNPHIQAWGRKP